VDGGRLLKRISPGDETVTSRPFRADVNDDRCWDPGGLTGLISLGIESTGGGFLDQLSLHATQMPVTRITVRSSSSVSINLWPGARGNPAVSGSEAGDMVPSLEEVGGIEYCSYTSMQLRFMEAITG